MSITIKSCEKGISKTSLNRNLFVYSGNTIRKEKYIMTIEKEDSIWAYNYKNKTNSEKNMQFQFDLKTEILKSGSLEYKIVRQQEFYINNLSDIKFQKYELIENITDGTQPILFNSQYGILGIANVFAPEFVFLPVKERKEMADIIRKRLIK